MKEKTLESVIKKMNKIKNVNINSEDYFNLKFETMFTFNISSEQYDDFFKLVTGKF